MIKQIDDLGHWGREGKSLTTTSSLCENNFFFYQGIALCFPKTVLWLTNYFRDQLSIERKFQVKHRSATCCLVIYLGLISFFKKGIIGFSLSVGTIQRWVLASHVVVKIKSDMEKRVGLKKRCFKSKIATATKNRIWWRGIKEVLQFVRYMAIYVYTHWVPNVITVWYHYTGSCARGFTKSRTSWKAWSRKIHNRKWLEVMMLISVKQSKRTSWRSSLACWWQKRLL